MNYSFCKFSVEFPGHGLIGVGIEFAGTCLVAKASQKDMDNLRNAIEKEENSLIKETLQKKLEEMESRKSEVRTDWKNVKDDFGKMFEEAKEDNRKLVAEAQFIKDVALHTRLMIEDLKYKVDNTSRFICFKENIYVRMV